MVRRVWTVVALITLASAAAVADETPQAPDKAAQQKAAMEAMMRAATPGEAHKKLNAMAGTFDAKVKTWTEPGAAPMESSGKSVNEWVLGGRWLQQRFESTFMNMPFSGIGYTGYDNIRQMYVGTWMDTMSTSAMTISGSAPEGSGKTWSFSGMMMDPTSGEAVNYDEKITVIDNDHHILEMYGPAPNGSMFKMMEISYTRHK
jgi:hypothetical protein